MIIKSAKIAATLLWLSAAGSVNAMGISLLNTVGNSFLDVRVGDVFTVEVVMDFISEPTLGGGFNVGYNTDDLALVDFASFDIGGFVNRDPDVSDGLLSAWAFSDFNGLGGPLVVGTMSFEVLPGAVGGTIALWEDIGGIGGAFTSAVTFVPYFPGQLSFESLTYLLPFPVPAAIWFMLSGVGVLLGFGRRKAA